MGGLGSQTRYGVSALQMALPSSLVRSTDVEKAKRKVKDALVSTSCHSRHRLDRTHMGSGNSEGLEPSLSRLLCIEPPATADMMSF